MARVTVEDCVLRVPNRFELVMVAAQRARDISSGAELSVERDNDKNPVVALREIAEEMLELDQLRNELIEGLQKHVEVDEPEEDEMDSFAVEGEMVLETVTEDDISEDGMSIHDAADLEADVIGDGEE